MGARTGRFVGIKSTGPSSLFNSNGTIETQNQMRKKNRLKILATDLDGTLIPLADHPQQCRDLEILTNTLSQQAVQIVFVTGRHLDSVVGAIEEFKLPKPKTVICDVGSSMFHCDQLGNFRPDEDYIATLQQILGSTSLVDIREAIVAKNLKELRLQEEFKQGQFKLSFYSTPERLLSTSKKSNRW